MEGRYKKIKKAKVGEKVIGEENKATSLLRDILNSSFDNIVIDDKDLFEEVKDYVKKFEPKKEKIVKYYSSPAPIFEVYGIEKQLQDLFGKQYQFPMGVMLLFNTRRLFMLLMLIVVKQASSKSRRICFKC